MTRLSTIPCQRQDFYTSRNAAWKDGFPLMGITGPGGCAPLVGNVGNASPNLISVDPTAEVGVYVATVTSIVAGVAYVSVQDTDDNLLGAGAIGIPFYAGGLTIRIDPNSVASVVGDKFLFSTLPMPLDVSGLQFTLEALRPPSQSNIALVGDTNGSPPTLLSGGVGGTLATAIPRSVMSVLGPGTYPYNVFAQHPNDPNERRVVFYGNIIHDYALEASTIDA